MLARLGPSQPAQSADVIARAMGALALIALAVIHVVDLPGTLGPTPLVGIGYLGIIAAALGIGGVLIARSHWLVWAAAGAVAVMAMSGYVLTRALPGRIPGRSRRCRQLALPARHCRPQRGDADHPARGARRLAGPGPRRERGRASPGLPGGARRSTASPDDHARAGLPRSSQARR